MFCLGDGSARFIAETVELDVYRSLGSRNGREAVDEF
jgi:hypothetical protein